MCLCFTRKFRTTEGHIPDDVREICKDYAEGGALVNPEQLRRFLVEFQGESEVNLAEAERIADQLRQRGRRHHIGKPLRSLSPEDFLFFLFSADLNPAIKSQVFCLLY